MASPASTKKLFGAKHIVFAGIAFTVVMVVAFAAGVVVGRDTPNRAGGAAGNPAPAAPPAPPRLVIVGEPEGEPAADALDEVTYPDRLGTGGPPDETLRGLPLYTASVAPRVPEPAEMPAEVLPDAVTAAVAPSVDPAGAEPPDAAAPAMPPPESDPFTVQVAALRAADAAEVFAGQLLAKGFPAYVVQPSPDGPVAMYRVRVGQYADRGEAERVLQRLELEEELTPWITR